MDRTRTYKKQAGRNLIKPFRKLTDEQVSDIVSEMKVSDRELKILKEEAEADEIIRRLSTPPVKYLNVGWDYETNFYGVDYTCIASKIAEDIDKEILDSILEEFKVSVKKETEIWQKKNRNTKIY
jgi:hypothetical protein